MAPLGAVIIDPAGEDFSGLPDRQEQGIVEKLFAHATVDPKGGGSNLSTNPFCVGWLGAM